MRQCLYAFLVIWAMALAPAADAHVDPVGTLLADGRSSLGLTAHNDRDETMTGFRVALPAGFTVVSARVGGWDETVAAREVTWAGELGAGEGQSFVLELEGSSEPGPVEIPVEQLYAAGEAVPWTVAVTAVPGTLDESSGGVGWRDVLIVAALGVLTVAVVLVMRRNRSLQEK